MSIIAERYKLEEKMGFPSPCGVLFAPSKNGEISKIVGRYVIYRNLGTVYECTADPSCDFEYVVKDLKLVNVEINGQKLIKHNKEVHNVLQPR